MSPLKRSAKQDYCQKQETYKPFVRSSVHLFKYSSTDSYIILWDLNSVWLVESQRSAPTQEVERSERSEAETTAVEVTVMDGRSARSIFVQKLACCHSLDL